MITCAPALCRGVLGLARVGRVTPGQLMRSDMRVSPLPLACAQPFTVPSRWGHNRTSSRPLRDQEQRKPGAPNRGTGLVHAGPTKKEPTPRLRSSPGSLSFDGSRPRPVKGHDGGVSSRPATSTPPPAPLSPISPRLSHLVELLARARSKAVVHRVLRERTQGLSSRGFTVVMRHLGEREQFLKVLWIKDWMVGPGGKVLDLFHYNTLVGACEKAGRWEDAVAIFQELQAAGLKPDLITYGWPRRALSPVWHAHSRTPTSPPAGDRSLIRIHSGTPRHWARMRTWIVSPPVPGCIANVTVTGR